MQLQLNDLALHYTNYTEPLLDISMHFALPHPSQLRYTILHYTALRPQLLSHYANSMTASQRVPRYVPHLN